jgi:uncharacterized protein (TIGR00369 family)
MDQAIEREIQRIFRGAPFIVGLGLRLDTLAPGVCHTVLDVDQRHLQQDGFVHAGVQATVADHSAGAAAATQIGAGQSVHTAEFKINLLRPAKGSRLSCQARVLKPGRTLSVVESEVYCGEEGAMKLVAKATVTLAVVDLRAGGA